ncbi:hypothetical protein HK096_003535 [Nowakowskiella sp. JEL0078]|nr:hypothetical protein HK096_003535 [Nowakowskiella sp. JEL0078]
MLKNSPALFLTWLSVIGIIIVVDSRPLNSLFSNIYSRSNLHPKRSYVKLTPRDFIPTIPITVCEEPGLPALSMIFKNPISGNVVGSPGRPGARANEFCSGYDKSLLDLTSTNFVNATIDLANVVGSYGEAYINSYNGDFSDVNNGKCLVLILISNAPGAAVMTNDCSACLPVICGPQDITANTIPDFTCTPTDIQYHSLSQHNTGFTIVSPGANGTSASDVCASHGLDLAQANNLNFFGASSEIYYSVGLWGKAYIESINGNKITGKCLVLALHNHVMGATVLVEDCGICLPVLCQSRNIVPETLPSISSVQPNLTFLTVTVWPVQTQLSPVPVTLPPQILISPVTSKPTQTSSASTDTIQILTSVDVDDNLTSRMSIESSTTQSIISTTESSRPQTSWVTITMTVSDGSAVITTIINPTSKTETTLVKISPVATPQTKWVNIKEVESGVKTIGIPTETAEFSSFLYPPTPEAETIGLSSILTLLEPQTIWVTGIVIESGSETVSPNVHTTPASTITSSSSVTINPVQSTSWVTVTVTEGGNETVIVTPNIITPTLTEIVNESPPSTSLLTITQTIVVIPEVLTQTTWIPVTVTTNGIETVIVTPSIHILPVDLITETVFQTKSHVETNLVTVTLTMSNSDTVFVTPIVSTLTTPQTSWVTVTVIESGIETVVVSPTVHTFTTEFITETYERINSLSSTTKTAWVTASEESTYLESPLNITIFQPPKSSLLNVIDETQQPTVISTIKTVIYSVTPILEPPIIFQTETVTVNTEVQLTSSAAKSNPSQQTVTVTESAVATTTTPLITTVSVVETPTQSFFQSTSYEFVTETFYSEIYVSSKVISPTPSKTKSAVVIETAYITTVGGTVITEYQYETVYVTSYVLVESIYEATLTNHSSTQSTLPSTSSITDISQESISDSTTVTQELETLIVTNFDIASATPSYIVSIASNTLDFSNPSGILKSTLVNNENFLSSRVTNSTSTNNQELETLIVTSFIFENPSSITSITSITSVTSVTPTTTSILSESISSDLISTSIPTSTSVTALASTDQELKTVIFTSFIIEHSSSSPTTTRVLSESTVIIIESDLLSISTPTPTLATQGLETVIVTKFIVETLSSINISFISTTTSPSSKPTTILDSTILFETFIQNITSSTIADVLISSTTSSTTVPETIIVTTSSESSTAILSDFGSDIPSPTTIISSAIVSKTNLASSTTTNSVQTQTPDFYTCNNNTSAVLTGCTNSNISSIFSVYTPGRRAFDATSLCASKGAKLSWPETGMFAQAAKVSN